MPGVGLEPTNPEGRRILSPLRLPIPPPRHVSGEPIIYARNRAYSVTTFPLARQQSIKLLIAEGIFLTQAGGMRNAGAAGSAQATRPSTS